MSKTGKTVQDFMSNDVRWVSPTAKLSEVAQQMSERDCGCVFVGENDKLVGVITDRDIVTRSVAKGLNPAQTEARSVMSKKVLYCRTSDSVEATIENMAKNQVRRLLVVDANKRLQGVVTLGDLAAASGAQSASGQALASICSAPSRKAA